MRRGGGKLRFRRAPPRFPRLRAAENGGAFLYRRGPLATASLLEADLVVAEGVTVVAVVPVAFSAGGADGGVMVDRLGESLEPSEEGWDLGRQIDDHLVLFPWVPLMADQDGGEPPVGLVHEAVGQEALLTICP